jgi:GNAT superfamily N-acetyltransferase
MTDIRRVVPKCPMEVFDRVARLHCEAVPHGFLSTLGEGVLATLYRGLVCDPSTVLLVGSNDSFPLGAGYICVTADSRSAYRIAITRYFPRLALTLLRGGVNPQRAHGLLETFRARGAGDVGGNATILNFAVDQSARGTGIGRALFARAMSYLRDLDVRRVDFVVGRDQGEARSFYAAAGAIYRWPIVVHRGTSSESYTLHLDPP